MEQRLDATYLRPGLVERVTAIGIGAVCIGTGVLLAAWGISFLWRYTPPEVAVRIANPEVHIAEGPPLKVTQDKPFEVTQPEPFKVDTRNIVVRGDDPTGSIDTGVRTDQKTGEVIKRDVTVFSTVRHGLGTVTTGWIYSDGSGGIPHRQYCYYDAPNIDNSSRRVDIALNGTPLPINAGLVPDLGDALSKCQWWHEGAMDKRVKGTEIGHIDR
jgi:hypothetical protein